MRQLLIFVVVLSGVLFLLSIYPNLRLKRIQSGTNSLVVQVVKDDDKWSEYQSGVFKLTGSEAKEFLTKIFDSSKLDQSRFSSKLELRIYSLDDNGKFLGSIVLRNDFGYRFDWTSDPHDASNPLKKFVELAQHGRQVSDAEFHEIRSGGLIGRDRNYTFAVSGR